MTKTDWFAARNIAVRAEYIAMLAPFICPDEIRYYLHGIHIQPSPTGEGVLMVATDGVRLGVIHDRHGHTDRAWTCRIPASVASACAIRTVTRKTAPTKMGAGICHFIGGAVYVTKDGFKGDPTALSEGHLAATFAKPIDGTYPDWVKVIRAPGGSHAKMSFDSARLAAFGKVAQVRNGRKEPAGVRVVPTGDDTAPVIVQVGAVPEFFGMLMPFRCSVDEAPIPGWLPKLHADEAMAA